MDARRRLPAFAVAQFAWPNCAFCPFTDEMLMIRPHCLASISSMTCLVALKRLLRFVSMTPFQYQRPRRGLTPAQKTLLWQEEERW